MTPLSRAASAPRSLPLGTEPAHPFSRVGQRGARVAGGLAGVGVLAEVGYPLAHGSARAALTAAAVLACCAAMLTHAAATRGTRTAFTLLAVFGVGGFLVEAVGVSTGVPFGAYHYAAAALGPSVLSVPLLVGCAWCMTAWPAYLAALWLLPYRSRAARTLLAAAALAAWDLFLDPQMVAAGYWSWRHPAPGLPGLAGVPLTNFAGWLLTATVLMIAFELAAGRTARWAGRDRSDGVPLGLYLWTYGSSVLAHAAFLGLPGSAAWGGVGMGLVAVPLAVRLACR
jgi:uncharacterized membrane protein